MLVDRYFTVMIIPEREKGVRTFKIPKIFFRAVVFTGLILGILISIFIYDYWKILRQIYENQYLTIENRQMKEQIQLFQIKIDTLQEDIEQIRIFERKLKIITGLDGRKLKEKSSSQKELFPPQSSVDQVLSSDAEYQHLKMLYEKKIATIFGLVKGHHYTKDWLRFTKKTFKLAEQYARFDYDFNILKAEIQDLEIQIHAMDQFLLDKESFLRSTPTILPTKGWITSSYGPRINPISKILKMHEGLDIGARTGTSIIAPADGIVSFSGSKPGFGKIIQIDHGYGIETIYAHAKKLTVKRGERITRGQAIASVGNTGRSTGPHLHYEVRINGTPVDPLLYTLE